MVIETKPAGQQTLNTAAHQSIRLQVRMGDTLGRDDQELEGGPDPLIFPTSGFLTGELL